MKETGLTMVGNWIVERRRSRYTILYSLSLVVGMFLETTPFVPDVTYTLRHRDSGARRQVTLPGDHTPDQLSAVVEILHGTP